MDIRTELNVQKRQPILKFEIISVTDNRPKEKFWVGYRMPNYNRVKLGTLNRGYYFLSYFSHLKLYEQSLCG
jgi:hypothetical protein